MAVRFASTQYSPGLFDVAHDITGGLPAELIEGWLESDQRHEDALRLLAPHRVVGFNMMSDTTGLSRLTQDRGLLEILAIVNQPKEIVYQVGTAIGGAGVGIWAADNTQMFFPERMPAELVVAAMLSIQDEVQRRCRVQVGVAAHFGEFYKFAGGLFGEASELLEEFAENRIVDGEVVISRAVFERLPADRGFDLVAREGSWSALGAVYTVRDGPRLTDLPQPRGHHPFPYSAAFHRDLVALAADLDDHALARTLTEEHTRDRVVVLVEREAQHADSHEVGLFNNFALSATLREAGRRHLREEHGEEIKVAGAIGIYTFEDPGHAIEFAETLRRELSADGIDCRIGVDAGPVLIFELAGGDRDIAGGPLAVASKLAQDRGQWGRIYLTDRVYEHVDVRGYQPISCTVGGVDMHAFEG